MKSYKLGVVVVVSLSRIVSRSFLVVGHELCKVLKQLKQFSTLLNSV